MSENDIKYELMFKLSFSFAFNSALYVQVGSSEGKATAYNTGDLVFNPWVRKIPWRRQWQPTPVFLPGKSHGLRSLVGYNPWGHKELDTTERLHFTTALYSSFFIGLKDGLSAISFPCTTLHLTFFFPNHSPLFLIYWFNTEQ